jgi:hypothetical protein
MVIRARLAAPTVLAILVACRAPAPPTAIDPALSARVPAATIALAGIDLDRLRASPLYPKLPPEAQAFLEPFRQAHHVLIASTGAELLTIARGVIPGATRLAPDLALYGAPSLNAAATAAHAPASILAPAESVAAANPVWIALRVGVALPLSGNWSNVNNLLRDTEYVTLTLRPDDPSQLELSAHCPTPNAALRFEQSFRAIVSLAAATSARQRSTAGVLESIRINRDDRTVHVSLSAALDAFATLLP